MTIPSFPRYSAKGVDRTKKVVEMERMYKKRAKFHVYYTVNSVMHVDPSWAVSRTKAADDIAEFAARAHRGAKYALIGVITLDRKQPLGD